MDIEGNEEADTQAKLGASDDFTGESGPTSAGIRSIGRKLLQLAAHDAWSKAQCRLSAHYRQNGGVFSASSKCPESLKINRTALGKLLALKTTHGDFTWYHKKYKHDDYQPNCSCGRTKTPQHLVHCVKSRRLFNDWPWPKWMRRRPTTDRPATRNTYFSLLLRDASLFAQFLEVTDFYRKICPRA